MIDRWIDVEPGQPGNVWVATYNVEVWVLIAATGGQDDYAEAAARDYHVPADAVRAALAYYRRHPLQIDAKIERLRAAEPA